jgi:hypothetical protein
MIDIRCTFPLVGFQFGAIYMLVCVAPLNVNTSILSQYYLCSSMEIQEVNTKTFVSINAY